MPASKMFSAGGLGCTMLQLLAPRAAATADFSLQVLTKARYFWRLS